jgi:uncharacterized protein DUF4157
MDRHSIERQHNAAIRRQADASAAESAAESHPLLQLQRQVGNAQIARMLAQRQAPDEEEIQASRLQRQEAPEEEQEEMMASRLQREGDEDELMASRLQRQEAPEEEQEEMMASRLQREGDEDELMASRLQREGEAEEDEMMASRDLAQREPEVGLEGGPVSSGVADRISAQRGGGSSLDDGLRTNMESGFGADFSDVRVHSGGEAASLNRSIAARAFTTGSDIFLGDSASASDSSLMAHELTHVVQQREMSGSGGPMTVTAAGDMHEQEADATASAVTSGAPAPGAAQRKADEQR